MHCLSKLSKLFLPSMKIMVGKFCQNTSTKQIKITVIEYVINPTALNPNINSLHSITVLFLQHPWLNKTPPITLFISVGAIEYAPVNFLTCSGKILQY